MIDKVIEQMSDWSASAISGYHIKICPGRQPLGGYYHYNLAFYRELPYSVRVYEEDEEG